MLEKLSSSGSHLKIHTLDSNKQMCNQHKKPTKHNRTRNRPLSPSKQTRSPSEDTQNDLLTPPNSPTSSSSQLPSSSSRHYHKKKNNQTYECNHRILTAKRNGDLRTVMNEFISMKKNKIQMTHHTYNLVLEAHILLRREGTPLTQMLKLYQEMAHYQIRPNTYTYVLMIRSLCKRDVEVQKTVAMLKRQSARIGHNNEDVGLLESEGNLTMALAIFHHAVANDMAICSFEIEIFNQLLRVLSHYGNTADAHFVYAQLERPEVQAKPNSATYAALINLFGRAGDIQTALYYYDVYSHVKNTLGAHDASYIFNALVDCHLKCGMLDAALHVVEHDMAQHHIKLTCIPYNSIIRHYCTHDQMKEAEDLIKRLLKGHQENGKRYPLPDASSYGPILSAYCQNDQWPEATRIYDALRETDISKAYGNLANYALLCLSHDDLDKALMVIHDMTKASLEPDPVLAERIVSRFAQSNYIEEAIQALELMEQVMSVRSLVKGAHCLLDAALEIVLHCTTVHQVLQVMHCVMSILRHSAAHPSSSESSSFGIMCKTLIDSYFDQPLEMHSAFSHADYRLLFESCFVVYSKHELPSLETAMMQILQDMHGLRIAVDSNLIEFVATRLQLYNQTEAEARWRAAVVQSSLKEQPEEINLQEEKERDDGDVIIEIVDDEESSLDGLAGVESTCLSEAEAASQAIFQAVQQGHGREAIQIFENRIICRSLIPLPHLMRDAIALAGKQGDLSTALTIYNNAIYAFKDMDDIQLRDEAIYWVTNSLLIGYAQRGEMTQARMYYDRIKAMGYSPDSDGYASLLLGSAQCATDEATDALTIYDEAKRHHVKPTTFFYNVVISKLAKARKLDCALALFEEMRQFHVPANSITYGAIISASVRSGSEHQSCRLFQEMLASPSYQPRVGPFNNMMQFYVRQHPNRERVLDYFNELRRRHIRPSPHSYKLLMEAYTHIAPYDMPMAHKLLGDMTRCDRLHPQATHYATLIYSYGLLQRDVQSAERVFQEMKRVKIHPDEAVYQAMIDTLISNNALEKAEKIYHEEMSQDKQLQKSRSPYIENLFIRGYGQSGQLEKAKVVFEAMSDDKTQQSVVIREPSSYEAMIQAYLLNDQTEPARAILDQMGQRDFPPKVIGVVADLF
ncbi:Pentatricopeptide repeat-containing protein 5, mitochondrial [Choanephora cucurbitarum]|uniref:Pentatricopeptide repeat-containing protein 5, mitochondrial n=1 Tax=Choanephora cucurbitarum TaxID=101091 RepID=A0A1C7NKU0_9FUNG|nr:Pentatricopeptide repeat-containing protein 5, mitochondrial [Choanephora cucurbitarum]